jgi:hypothetical protein
LESFYFYPNNNINVECRKQENNEIRQTPGWGRVGKALQQRG